MLFFAKNQIVLFISIMFYRLFCTEKLKEFEGVE